MERYNIEPNFRKIFGRRLTIGYETLLSGSFYYSRFRRTCDLAYELIILNKESRFLTGLTLKFT